MAGINSLAISKSLPLAGDLVLVAGTAQALPHRDTGHGLTEITVQADVNNTDDVLMGNATNQTWRLHPDDEFTIPLENPDAWYFKAAGGTQTLHYFGRD